MILLASFPTEELKVALCLLPVAEVLRRVSSRFALTLDTYVSCELIVTYILAVANPDAWSNKAEKIVELVNTKRKKPQSVN